MNLQQSFSEALAPLIRKIEILETDLKSISESISRLQATTTHGDEKLGLTSLVKRVTVLEAEVLEILGRDEFRRAYVKGFIVALILLLGILGTGGAILLDRLRTILRLLGGE